MSDAKSRPVSDPQEVDDKMDAEDQFCLQWNDHKNTLVNVFESLLESGTLVDCSLAAEGRFLKAHKVVLSACSPYFELLFSEHREKHPILILKDVKFQELKALMDYMYRGEVNIPQDRLQALLETAESLQIKGLGGCKAQDEVYRSHKHNTADRQSSSTSPTSLPRHSGSEVMQSSRVASPAVANMRKDSGSPTPRKRSRLQPSTEEGTSGHAPATDVYEQRNELPSPLPQSRPTQPSRAAPSVEISSVSSSPVPASSTLSITSSTSGVRREWTRTESEQHSSPVQQRSVLPMLDFSSEREVNVKTEPISEILVEPKTEYVEEILDDDTTENSVVLDDVDYMGEPKSGPSRGEEGTSSQGHTFAPWLGVADWASRDAPSQQAVGTFREHPDTTASARRKSWTWKYFRQEPGSRVRCCVCDRMLKYDSSFGPSNMSRHLRIHKIVQTSATT